MAGGSTFGKSFYSVTGASTPGKWFHSVLTAIFTDKLLALYILRLTCGAKTRRGTPCKLWKDTHKGASGKYRCKYHGGASTGPKTAEGKARSAKNLILAWQVQRSRKQTP